LLSSYHSSLIIIKTRHNDPLLYFFCLSSLLQYPPSLSSNTPFASLLTFHSAIVGFTRSFGHYLPAESITLNAVCPNVIRTSISTPAFYDKLASLNLLTPMSGLISAFESMLCDSKVSGEIFKVGPNGGFSIKKAPEYLDKESEEVIKLLEVRGRVLQEPRD
jgi:hypothetical protein